MKVLSYLIGLNSYRSTYAATQLKHLLKKRYKSGLGAVKSGLEGVYINYLRKM